MRKIRGYCALGILGLLLSGCSTGQNSSLDEGDTSPDPIPLSVTRHSVQQRRNVNMEMGNLSIPLQPSKLPIENLSGVERIPEQHLRIWIAPYQDEEGHLHEESSIQAVIKGGRWKLPMPTLDEDKAA